MANELYVLMAGVWAVSGIAGLVLALYGWGIAGRDLGAVEVSGVNGLVLYLAVCASRSWLARIALQAVAIVWGAVALATQAPVLPPDAPPDAVARLVILRVLLILMSLVMVGQSGLDLWGRTRAGELADALPAAGPGE